MKEIVVNPNEIAHIIAEKYGVDYKKGDDIILTVESRTVNYNTINAKKVYYPVAYIWKGSVENDNKV